MDRDPVADARDLVHERFPTARWAVVTGSVVTARRTAGSDLDVVVMMPDGDERVPFRQSLFWRGWPVELFVHDEASLEAYLAKSIAGRKPILQRMIAEGFPVTGDGPDLDALRVRCRQVL